MKHKLPFYMVVIYCFNCNHKEKAVLHKNTKFVTIKCSKCGSSDIAVHGWCSNEA